MMLINAVRSKRHFAPLFLSFALLALFAAATTHAQSPALVVKGAWARTPLAPRNNTSVYFSVENPAAAARTIASVTSEDAGKAEMHEMKMTGTMMQMSPVKELAVPAKGTVELKPGGYHIMLFDLKHPLKGGDKVNLVLHLSDGSTVPVVAPVRALDEEGAAPTGGMNMGGMKGMKP
jgi:copper(I)-binding protein